METQRGQETYLRAHSIQLAERGFKLGFLAPQGKMEEHLFPANPRVL